jgi:hypothetical protein
MSPGGTAKDESLEFVPLDKGIEALRKLRRAFCDRGQNKSPLSISPPFVLRKAEKEFVSLDPNGF